MLHAMRLLLGAMAVMFGSVLLAQPKAAPTDSYFPLKVKTKWVYRVGDNEVTVMVVKAEKVNNEEQYQVDTIVGKEPKTTEWYVVRPDGVYRTKVKDDKLDPPIKVLPIPAKKDTTWDVNSKLGTQTIKGTMKVVSDQDKIKLFGTDYETVLVEGKDMDVAGAKTSVKIWFAKDRGIVKEEFVLQGGEKLSLELKEISEGK